MYCSFVDQILFQHRLKCNTEGTLLNEKGARWPSRQFANVLSCYGANGLQTFSDNLFYLIYGMLEFLTLFHDIASFFREYYNSNIKVVQHIAYFFSEYNIKVFGA